MKLIFLGTGSAFTVGDNNYHSNMLLTNGEGQNFLIDCGSDVRHSLHEQGLSYKDIEHVYISHLHADHMGGLEWLGFTHKFDPSCHKPHLYINQPIANVLWDQCLSGSMSSIEGEICTIDTFFHLHPFARNDAFRWENIVFHPVQTIHIMHGFSLGSCHGLFFEVNGKKIYITADTQFAPALLMATYEKADIIFHDCETAPHRSGVHPTYSELCTLPEKIKKKIWLYHYQPGPLPDAKADGFAGFVKKGQAFEF